MMYFFIETKYANITILHLYPDAGSFLLIRLYRGQIVFISRHLTC